MRIDHGVEISGDRRTGSIIMQREPKPITIETRKSVQAAIAELNKRMEANIEGNIKKEDGNGLQT